MREILWTDKTIEVIFAKSKQDIDSAKNNLPCKTSSLVECQGVVILSQLPDGNLGWLVQD